MPDVSAFCPVCGRSVQNDGESESPGSDVPPLSRIALVAVVAYMTFVPALIFLFVPALKNVRFVRFHALQSLLFVGATLVIAGATRLAFLVLALFPFLGFLWAWLLAGLVALAVTFLWVVLVIKAALGEAYELPVIGPWAARLSGRA